jgi:hypothetical protein
MKIKTIILSAVLGIAVVSAPVFAEDVAKTGEEVVKVSKLQKAKLKIAELRVKASTKTVELSETAKAKTAKAWDKTKAKSAELKELAKAKLHKATEAEPQ